MIHAEGIEDYTSYLLIVTVSVHSATEKRASKDVKVIFIR